MKDIYTRTKQIAEYVILTGATVRAASKVFGISKSTVHYDLTKRLPYLDAGLYDEVQKILDLNFKEKSMRGGLATKHKYNLKRC